MLIQNFCIPIGEICNSTSLSPWYLFYHFKLDGKIRIFFDLVRIIYTQNLIAKIYQKEL